MADETQGGTSGGGRGGYPARDAKPLTLQQRNNYELQRLHEKGYGPRRVGPGRRLGPPRGGRRRGRD